MRAENNSSNFLIERNETWSVRSTQCKMTCLLMFMMLPMPMLDAYFVVVNDTCKSHLLYLYFGFSSVYGCLSFLICAATACCAKETNVISSTCATFRSKLLTVASKFIFVPIYAGLTITGIVIFTGYTDANLCSDFSFRYLFFALCARTIYSIAGFIVACNCK